MPSDDLTKLSAASAVADVSATGAFARKQSTFLNAFEGEYAPEAGRYELNVSLACPWACRVLAVIKLKGLEHVFDVKITHPVWARTKPGDASDTHCGWVFVDADEATAVTGPSGKGEYAVPKETCSPSGSAGVKTIRALYDMVGAPAEQRFTVPLIWDTKTKTIVNNESSVLVRELNSKFNHLATNPGLDLYPEHLRAKIDEINDWVYHSINNGVYKCGFAVSQSAYDEAVDALFRALDRCDALLAEHRYIAGDVFTEADVRLFQTLIRFDEVYVVYFKTNKKFIHQYEHLGAYVRECYQMDAMRVGVVDDWHIKTHYFASHPVLNAHGIIPAGPGVDLFAPHGRDGSYPR
jgi:putative glutathione S-transferase